MPASTPDTNARPPSDSGAWKPSARLREQLHADWRDDPLLTRAVLMLFEHHETIQKHLEELPLEHIDSNLVMHSRHDLHYAARVVKACFGTCRLKEFLAALHEANQEMLEHVDTSCLSSSALDQDLADDGDADGEGADDADPSVA